MTLNVHIDRHVGDAIASSPTISRRQLLREFLARRASGDYPLSDHTTAPASDESRIVPDPSAPRRVITHDEAMALAEFVREVTEGKFTGVAIAHAVTAVATQRVGNAPRSGDADELELRWPTRLGNMVNVGISTNVRDPDTLRRVIHRAAATKAPPMTGPLAEEDPDLADAPRPATYMPVSLWYPSTSTAMTTERGTALAQLTAPFHGTAWHGVGTVAMSAKAFLYLSPDGSTTAWGDATDAEVSMTARAADGSAAGWSGRAHRDWRQLHPADVAQAAIAAAEQQRNPSRAEPGRYTAILSATAVGQLLHAMAGSFNVARQSPFNLPTTKEVGQKDRRGERLFDPRVTLSSDPTDPDGGDWPFFYGDGGMGEPNPKSIWVEHGVLKLRSVDVGTGLQYGMIPRKDPLAMRMNGGPTSVAEMIANCERGIYVHRFANLEVIDGLSGAMSGYTRDGCLFIQNGKIVRPVKDFRIFESPFLSLNRVLALGTPERIAFGFTPPNPYRREQHWPLPPVIAPPLMVSDFNFAALADNV